MSYFRYRSRFVLPVEVADFVCALALELDMDADRLLASMVRMWAREHPDARDLAWERAIEDHRNELWKNFGPPR